MCDRPSGLSQPVPRLLSTLCALCVGASTKPATTEIDGVLLCAEHVRVAAMKRLGLVEEDLKAAERAS